MVYRFIDDNKERFGLRWLCSRLNVSTSCYYNYLKDKKRKYRIQKKFIYEKIKYIFYNNNRVVGYRVMQKLLLRHGISLSNNTVHKYMNKDLNLAAVIMRAKGNYKTGRKHKIFDNLLNQNFHIEKKNSVWCTDFTYMRQPNGKFRYNCTIIDLYDRSVVASVNAEYINSTLAINTLKEALKEEHYPENLILHSDQGVQYTSWEFVNFCKEAKIRQSMSKAGCPYDNAPMERYYNTFKNCFYYQYSFESITTLDDMTREYVHWYNYVRPHSANNYLTPMEARYK